MFFFKSFPRIDYDVLNRGSLQVITHPLVRFKVAEALITRQVSYYDHNVRDGERADVIAAKYYEDETLDWLIWIANDIVDPQYDWPLDYQDFNNFIINKYGSVSSAMQGVHEYQYIIQHHNVLYDGSIIAEKTLAVDSTTYATLDSADQRTLSSYDYELAINDNKRKIRVIDRKYINSIIAQVQSIFQ